jgi:hypothetical protein
VHRHRPAARLRPLQLGRQATALNQGEVGFRAVGGIGPDLAGRVRRIEDRAELAAIVRRGVGDGEAPDQTVLPGTVRNFVCGRAMNIVRPWPV